MMDGNTLQSGMCRCCSSEGTFKDIKTKYHWMGEEEVYADMLTDCFDIKISTPENMDNGICEVCITQLRNAANFKKQVLHTEEQFKKRLQGLDIKNPIKLESVEDPIESDHLSDPDFSGAEYDVPIKEEEDVKPKAKKRPAKPAATRAKKAKPEAETSKQHNSEDGSFLVKVESNCEPEEEILEENNSVEDNDNNKDSYKVAKRIRRPLKRKLLVVLPEISSNSIVLKKTTELDLHLHNLQIVMKCSNATPLRMHGKWYTCCFCPERYSETATLKNHTIEKHPNGKPAFVGRNVSELIIRVDITDLQCSLCQTKVDGLQELIKHLKEDHSQSIHTRLKNYMIPFKFDAGKQLICAICKLEFHNFKMLVQHMHVHYPNFVCGACGSGFVNQRSLQNHASRHANGEHKCVKCQRIFDNDAKLKAHMKSVHEGFNKRNKCDHCPERFISYIAKNEHMIKAHGMPAIQAKCPACDKTFKNYKYLGTHKRTFHMMEKRHKCSECDRMFYSTHEVKQHMLTHTGQRDFQCVVCSKSYGRKSTLREHMRIHEDDRRFKCEHCGVAFVQKCSWRGHMRSKHGEEV